MDIKWKNKIMPFILRGTTSYLFAISILTGIYLVDYYNNLKADVEVIITILVGCLASGIALYMIRKKYTFTSDSIFTHLGEWWIRKVSLDFRLLIMLALGLFMFPMGEVIIEGMWQSGQAGRLLHLTFFTAWTVMFLLHIRGLITLPRNPVRLSCQWKRIWFVSGWKLVQQFSGNATPTAKRISKIATLLFVILLIVISTTPVAPLLAVLFLVICAIVVPRILKGVIHFYEIAAGAEQMANGNLNVVIPLYGRGEMTGLAVHLNQLNQGFQKAIEEQVASERMRVELITNVSHDLKTPLTSLVTYIDLLNRGDGTPEERERYVDVLSQKTQRLTMLVDDLFEAAKMASGAVELEVEQVDIVALLNQALAEFSDIMETSGLVFRINSTEPHCYANLDGRRTWRVFENLISNILKYAQKNTRVYIDLTQDRENVVLVLKNVSAQEMNFTADEIFERFKRGDLARTTEGSGLGLSIAKNIMELQGGEMKIDIDGDLFKVTVLFPKVIG